MEHIGKYEILGELGQGGMGTVFRGRDPVIGRDVAIKVIHEQALGAPEIKQRFYREARSAGRLAHENITVIYDIDEADGTPFLVMEYLDGEDLRTWLDRGAGLSNDEKLSIAVQIARGLHYAHEQGIIHRDIKPANIRILPNGRVKIMDFGIARIQNETQALTQTNLSLGTPRYMSPEQIKGEDLDRRSDLFSYGVLVYEIFTGQNPFLGDHVTTVIYKILHSNPPPLNIQPGTLSDQLQPIVERCMAKDRDARYPDCGAVLEAFLPLIRQAQTAALDQDETIALPHVSALDQTMLSAPTLTPRPPPPASEHAPTPPASTTEPPKRATKKALWAALGVVLALSLTTAGYFAFRSTGAEQAASAPTDEPENPTQNLTAALDSVAAAADSLLADDNLLSGSEDVPTTAPTQDDNPERRAADRERGAMDNARRRIVSRRNEADVATLFQRAEQNRRAGNTHYDGEAFAEAQNTFRTAREGYAEVKKILDTKDRLAAAAPQQPPPIQEEPTEADAQQEEPPSTGNQTDADRARTAMQTAQNNVPSTLRQTDAYQRARAQETEGAQAYTARAYDRAVARFEAAKALFDEAAATPLSQMSAKASVNALAGRLKASLEQKDTATMKNVFFSDWDVFFNRATDISARVHTMNLKVDGTRATVDVRVEFSYQDDKNKPQDATTSYIWILEYQENDDTWVIVRLS